MKFWKRTYLIAASAVLVLTCGSRMVAAQSLDPAQQAHPAPDTWPNYHGDYTGKRHSKLTQINTRNVSNLGVSWAFQTGQSAQLKSTPLLVDGILYFTVPDNIWAVDARSGHMLWHYDHPTLGGQHIGHRGVAMYKGWLYFTTPDAHLISLNAKDGTVRWNKVIADVKQGLLVHNGAAGRAQPRHRRRVRRLRQHSPASLGRSILRPARAVGVGRHPARRHPQRDHRRHDLDDRHLRSRSESSLLGNRQSDPGV